MILETLGHLAAYALFVGACIGLALVADWVGGAR